MRLFLAPALSLAFGVSASLPLFAACGVDAAAVEARIADLEPGYSLVLSDISCDAPTVPAQQMLCESVATGDLSLWRMARLDDLAWVYAVENATGQQVDLTAPPRDDGFIAARDACTDEACLCAVLIGHTNASLGGTSPYPQ